MNGMIVQPLRPPCRGKDGAPCRERSVGCQSQCEAYGEYRKSVETSREAAQRDRVLNGYMDSAVKRVKRDGGSRPPHTIIKDAQRREQKKYRSAKVQINKTTNGGESL